ncbi:Uncharacterised protein [Mycobacteroides abscessus subsp. abscessus]|nr:Uncharacterised protein [Mycobacteroides abscessus subsp. abscessus]SIE90222.1 Uncharacterised protein [Mycobacteroides abscessus subsp. abscessus]SII13462.1 Uncharacterised protein [Mycobacteroides abscessus subsp. abscessus]SIK92270.1 Uncharacterised protein [Mycobacteroides abscessus subsp. abscessus]SIN02591.1 Uncharacterised protein [Mycobacteroides abscessus subsp. abscessus]
MTDPAATFEGIVWLPYPLPCPLTQIARVGSSGSVTSLTLFRGVASVVRYRWAVAVSSMAKGRHYARTGVRCGADGIAGRVLGDSTGDAQKLRAAGGFPSGELSLDFCCCPAGDGFCR